MKNLRNRVLFSAVVLAMVAATSAPAQVVSSTPIRARQGVVDANGDGICDISGRVIGSGAGIGQGQQARNGQRKGPGNGNGNGNQIRNQFRKQNGNGLVGNFNGMGRASARGRMNRGSRR
jgi:hypothetical protein